MEHAAPTRTSWRRQVRRRRKLLAFSQWHADCCWRCLLLLSRSGDTGGTSWGMAETTALFASSIRSFIHSSVFSCKMCLFSLPSFHRLVSFYLCICVSLCVCGKEGGGVFVLLLEPILLRCVGGERKAMTLPDMKYIVLLGSLPGEGIWASARSYSALVSQVQEAFGQDYAPIFKYKLPCNQKMLSPPNGTCDIIIDDEDDFQIWMSGCVPVAHHRDALDDIYYPPTPLTNTLYVFRKEMPISSSSSKPASCETRVEGHTTLTRCESSSPPVLHAENDVVKMPLYSLLPPLLLLKLGVRVALRHSSAAEAILLSSRSVSGAGEGHWGLLVRKAQSAWGVLRPSFRYLDLDRGVMAINIFGPRDYMFWSAGVGRERTELVVLEHVYRETAPSTRQITDALVATEGDWLRTMGEARTAAADTGREVSRRGLDGSCYTSTVAATVRGLHCGLFGPPFTSDAVLPLKPSAADDAEEQVLEHHRRLVASLVRNGIC